MPKKQIYDRVGTTTTRVVDHLALLVKAAKFDKQNPNVNYSTCLLYTSDAADE